MISIQLADDAAELEQIRLEALKTNPECFFESYSVISTKTDEYWQQLIDKQQYYTIKKDYRVIGMFAVYLDSDRAKCAGITSVYITPDERRNNYADSMIDFIVNKFKHWPLKLYVTTANIAANKLYEKHGFKKERETSGTYGDGNKYQVNVLIREKHLVQFFMG